MTKVKIKDIKDGSIKEVKKELADDYIGTGKFILVEDKPKFTSIENKPEEKKINSFKKEN